MSSTICIRCHQAPAAHFANLYHPYPESAYCTDCETIFISESYVALPGFPVLHGNNEKEVDKTICHHCGKIASCIETDSIIEQDATGSRYSNCAWCESCHRDLFPFLYCAKCGRARQCETEDGVMLSGSLFCLCNACRVRFIIPQLDLGLSSVYLPSQTALEDPPRLAKNRKKSVRRTAPYVKKCPLAPYPLEKYTRGSRGTGKVSPKTLLY